MNMAGTQEPWWLIRLSLMFTVEHQIFIKSGRLCHHDRAAEISINDSKTMWVIRLVLRWLEVRAKKMVKICHDGSYVVVSFPHCGGVFDDMVWHGTSLQAAFSIFHRGFRIGDYGHRKSSGGRRVSYRVVTSSSLADGTLYCRVDPRQAFDFKESVEQYQHVRIANPKLNRRQLLAKTLNVLKPPGVDDDSALGLLVLEGLLLRRVIGTHAWLLERPVSSSDRHRSGKDLHLDRKLDKGAVGSEYRVVSLKHLRVRVAKYDVNLRDAPLCAVQAMHTILSRMVLFTCNECNERFPTFLFAYAPLLVFGKKMEVLKHGKDGVAVCSVEVASWDELPPFDAADGLALCCSGTCLRCQKDIDQQGQGNRKEKQAGNLHQVRPF